MTKTFKRIFYLFAALIIVVIIAMGLLVTLVSPNKFKPLIVSQVLKATGRKLNIDGDLSWSFYPNVGVKVGHMVLENPAGFSSPIFAEIKSATLSVKLLPLLHSKIESNALAISGLQLNLEKNATGQANWTFNSAVAALAPMSNQNATPPVESKKRSFDFNLENVDLNHATVNYFDATSAQKIQINQLELHAKHLLNGSTFPVDASFSYSYNEFTQGTMSLTFNANFNIETQQLSLEKLDIKMQANKVNNKFDIHVHIAVIADLKEQTVKLPNVALELSGLNQSSLPLNVQTAISLDLAKQEANVQNITGSYDKLKFRGDAKFNNYLTNPTFAGNLQIPPFDLKAFLTAIKIVLPNVQTLKTVAGNYRFSGSLPKSSQATLLSTLDVTGKTTIGLVQASNVKIQNIAIDLHLKNAIANLTSITANLYGGQLAGQSTVNLQTSMPKFSLQTKLSNVQAEPLFADLEGADTKFKLKGAANLAMQITSQGLEPATLTRNLNGNMTFSFTNGVLDGININHYAQSAYALMKKESTPEQVGNSTDFGNLTGTALIQNGVIRNNDLLIDSPQFVTKGQGTIDLVNQQIDYALQTVSKAVAQDRAKNILNIYNLTIPLRIKGALSHPGISVDTSSILKQIAEQQLRNAKDKLQDHVKDQLREELKNKLPENLQDKLPGKAGELLKNFLGR